jgi:hypothetical protein
MGNAKATSKAKDKKFSDPLKTGSGAKGGIFDRNQIDAYVTAAIEDSTITSTGKIDVIADQVATIKATDISVISSENVTNGNASKAFGAVSVSNSILGKTLATVTDSTITKGVGAENDLTVKGTNAAVIESTALSEMSSGGKVVNAVIAFNSIGWQPQNLLFDLVETIIGSPEISQAFGNEDGFTTTSSIVDSDVDVAGSIMLSADNSARITAVNGNEAKQEWSNPFGVVAKQGAKGMAAGALLAMNKVSAAATATIQRTDNANEQVEADGSVTVEAKNEATISADIKVVATALPENTLAAVQQLVTGVAGRLGAGDYDYTTKSGIQKIEKGDTVRLELGYATGGLGGEVYRYIGTADITGIDLGTIDFSVDTLWQHLSTADYEDIFFPAIGNIVKTNAKSIGLSIAMNDVRGDASATIDGAVVDADGVGADAGNVVVKATNTSQIWSYSTNTVSASGGSGIDGSGKVLGLAGQIVTNVVLGKAVAGLDGAFVTAEGDVDVLATNDAAIDARNYSSGVSGATAVGITLSFNAVGWNSQNVLFNAIDTLIGANYIAGDGFGGDVGADATATIDGGTVNAGGKITVAADNSAQINSTISNTASTTTSALYGASGASYGIVLSGNKVSGKAVAAIKNAKTANGKDITAGNGVEVTAKDETGIYSNTKLVVETSVTSDAGVGIIQETLNDVLGASYDTQPDPAGGKIRDLKFGDRIRLDDAYGSPTIDMNIGISPINVVIAEGEVIALDDEGGSYLYVGATPFTIPDVEGFDFDADSRFLAMGGDAGAIYTFMGTDTYGADTDLTQVDYSDTDYWKKDPVTEILLHDLNLSVAPATSIGALVVLNDVRGGAAASIEAAEVEAGAGAVTVSADETATLRATADSAISAVGGNSLPSNTFAPNPKSGGVDENGNPKPPKPPSDTVLAINGTIATNLVQSSAVAKISDSTVTGQGDVTVSAINDAEIEAKTLAAATTSGGNTYGVVLAFNSVGWEPQNVLFNGIDAILGDDVLADDAFGLQNAAKAEAKVVSSTIDITGDLSVTADNTAKIDAEVSNEATSATTSIAGTDGKAMGFLVASNKVLGGAYATIDNTLASAAVVKANDVTVTASDDGEITSVGNILALAEISNDYGVSIATGIIESLIESYKYTTKSGTQVLNEGDLVFIGSDYPDQSKRGQIYRFVGADGTTVDLSGAIALNPNFKAFSFDGAEWTTGTGKQTLEFGDLVYIADTYSEAAEQGKVYRYIGTSGTEVDLDTLIHESADFIESESYTAFGVINALAANLAGGSATGVGAMAILNMVEGNSEALVTGAKLTLTGDLGISSTKTGLIDSDLTARVEVTGGTTDKSKSIAVNAVISTNNVLGTTSAKLIDSTINSGDNVSVTATNSGTIEATLDAETISKQTSIGIILAFNSVGVQNQNFLFNTVDAIVGTDLVDIIQGAPPVATTALVDGTTMDVTGGLNVEAHGDQTINAEISNMVRTLRFGGGNNITIGAVVALNRVTSTVTATISDSSKIYADGAVVVDADNTADITSEVIQPVIALSADLFQGAGTKSFGISFVISRNIIRADVDASIENVTDMDAGSVRVSADRAGTITSTAAAAAVAAAVALSGDTTSVSGGGAVSNNSLLGSAEALILNSNVSAPTGTVQVHAGSSGSIDATVLAAAVAVSGSFGGAANGVAIGAALAFNYIGYSGSVTEVGVATPTKTSASIRNSIVGGKKVKVDAASTETIKGTILAAAVAIGASSSGAKQASIAAGIVENRIAADTTALIDGGETPGSSTITVGSDGAEVLATSNNTIEAVTAAGSVAVSLSGGSSLAISIGAGIGLNDIKGTTKARLEDATITGSGPVTVKAEDISKISATAAAAAFAAGGSPSSSIEVSGGGAFAFNTIATDVLATILDSTVNVTGGVTVEVHSKRNIDATILAAAFSLAISGSTGVAAGFGVAVAENIIKGVSADQSQVKASVSSSDITSSGAIEVKALSEGTVDALVAAAAVAIGISGSTGLALGGAGAGTHNSINVATSALIDGSTTDIVGGSVNVSAEDNSLIKVLTGSAAVSVGIGSVGLGIALGISIALNEISADVTASAAGIAQLRANSGAMSVSAKRGGRVDATVAAAAISAGIGATGVGISGAGAAAVNKIGGDVVSTIASVGTVNSAGAVSVTASSTTAIEALVAAAAVAVGVGGAGVGVGIGISVALNTVADWDSGGQTYEELIEGFHDQVDKDDQVDKKQLEDTAEVKATIEKADVTAGGVVTVDASSNQTIKATVVAAAGALAAGGTGVGVAGAGVYVENQVVVETSAYVLGESGNKAEIDAAGVAITATNISSIDALAGAAALTASVGGVGVGVSVGIAVARNTVDNGVTAYAKYADLAVTDIVDRPAGSPPHAAAPGSILIKALADNTIDATSAAAAVALSGGAVGVSVAGGGAVAINTILGGATAYAEDSALDAGGDITVWADSTSDIDAKILAVAGSAAFGGVGVAVSIGIGIALNNIGYEIQAVDDRTTEEVNESTPQPKPLIVSSYLKNTSVDAFGALTVKAVSEETVDADVISGSVAIAGGAVAVAAGAAGSGTSNHTAVETTAYISGDGTGIKAGDVTVLADDTIDMHAYAGSASVAGAAGMFGGTLSLAVAVAENITKSTVKSYIEDAGQLVVTGTVAVDSLGYLVRPTLASPLQYAANTGLLQINAKSSTTLEATAELASVSVNFSIGPALAGGGGRTTNNVTAITDANLDSTVAMVNGDVTISAVTDVTTTALNRGVALALGLSLAVQGMDAQTDIDIDNTAGTANESSIDARDVTISALATPSARQPPRLR